MAKHWYLVHTRTLAEQQVVQSIDQQSRQRGLAAEVEAAVSLAGDWAALTARGSPSARQYHPGYVLVKCELTDEVLRLLKDTPNVTSFFGAGADDRPLPLPDGEVAHMLKTVRRDKTSPWNLQLDDLVTAFFSRSRPIA